MEYFVLKSNEDVNRPFIGVDGGFPYNCGLPYAKLWTSPNAARRFAEDSGKQLTLHRIIIEDVPYHF